jgi:polar amino acid transport system substrate-binding protein
MLHKLLPYLTLLLLICTTIAQAAPPTRLDSIVLAVEDSWPPYAGAEGRGISTSIIEKAFAEVDIRLLLKVSPYARVINEVEKGIIVGGYNVTRQASTDKKFIFGQQAILTASASLYFSEPNTQAKKYKSIADIPSGISMGLVIDYEYVDLFEQHKNLFKEVRVSNQKQIINMLRLGRIDSAIMFDAVADYTLKSMKLSHDSIFKGPLNHTSDIYVAFSRQHKNSQYFADKLDEGLTLIKAGGQYDRLLKQ